VCWERGCYICLLVDPYSRKKASHTFGARKDTGLVKVSASVVFPLFDKGELHTKCGFKIAGVAIDEPLEAF
jgi:hypothetical protein